MKKKIFAGLGILFAAVVLAFALPSYEEQVQAKNDGYDWGYYSADYRYRPDTKSPLAKEAARSRGYTKENGLQTYFIDGAAAGWTDKKNGNDYNNPYTVVTYIYNY